MLYFTESGCLVEPKRQDHERADQPPSLDVEAWRPVAEP